LFRKLSHSEFPLLYSKTGTDYFRNVSIAARRAAATISALRHLRTLALFELEMSQTIFWERHSLLQDARGEMGVGRIATICEN
jgi:hypothetical protein